MRLWNYSARWFEKGQEVTLLRDIKVWDQVKWWGKDSQEYKFFDKGTVARVMGYNGDGGYQLQIGDDTINHVPGYCFE